MTSLGDHVDGQPARKVRVDFAVHGSVVQISRSVLIDNGVVEPTAAEQEEMDASSELWEARRATYEAALTAWFAALRSVAGPVGVAMLDVHVADKYGDCKGCGFEEMAGIGWPCTTVLAGAEAAGLPEPRMI